MTMTRKRTRPLLRHPSHRRRTRRSRRLRRISPPARSKLTATPRRHRIRPPSWMPRSQPKTSCLRHRHPRPRPSPMLPKTTWPRLRSQTRTALSLTRPSAPWSLQTGPWISTRSLSPWLYYLFLRVGFRQTCTERHYRGQNPPSPLSTLDQRQELKGGRGGLYYPCFQITTTTTKLFQPSFLFLFFLFFPRHLAQRERLEHALRSMEKAPTTKS